MAKEILRGVHKSRKSGDISLQRWVQKATIDALKRLRGQGYKPHPTEGEVIDQAVAFFELHKNNACDALMPSGNGRRCQQWKTEHGDFHVNFEVGAQWPRVEVSVGENVGDGAFRGAKLSAEEQRAVAKKPSVFDEIYDRVSERVNTMQIAEDEVLHPSVPSSPLEQALVNEEKELKYWQEGPTSVFPPMTAEILHDIGKDRDETIAQVFCQHCMVIQEVLPDGPCPKCFAAGHRNNPATCFVCGEANG